MYDPREDLYGIGPDESERDDAKSIWPTSQSASPPLSPLILSTLEDEDGLSFPVYEHNNRDQEDQSSEHIESAAPSPNPSLIVRPISGVSIERPEDDTAARMLPVRHVDYLSHDWNEEDLWATWKHIVSERSAYNNSVRLENASWRSWEKMRRNLKTVSPGSVKWMKDHDVTWLYGPLQPGSGMGTPCRSDDSLRRRRRANSIRHHQKPILKKRSLSELMLRKSVSSASLLRQAATAAESFNIRNESILAYNSFLFASSTLSPPSSYVSEISTPNPNAWKNVRFYELVEQCVAVGNLDDDPPQSFSDLDDDVIVMRKISNHVHKQPSAVAAVLNTPPSRTIEKLPHAPLKSPEPPSCDGLGISYFPVQGDVSPSVETSPVPLEDESEDEDDDWKPPKWSRNRKDSVHLLHDKLDAIKRNIGTSPTSESLCDSRLAITPVEKGDISLGTVVAAEGRISPVTFKLTAFSFTSTSDMNTSALSSSSSDAGPATKSNWSAVDPVFTSADYFSPRSSDMATHDDDYDWIETYSPEEIINNHSPLHSNLVTPSPFPTRPLGFNTVLLPHDSTVSEKDPVARTSSDSGYGSEQLAATLRDTYNGTPEIEKERAVCDWDLYPGAWDPTELEEAVAWSRGF